ncbi:hypothetical protein LAZ67_9002886 [Cordylochernes scorpioides]|uniref:Uncharacterized protein n=1 Tax=Cordylochernes scorpioides TaxID=51811 RepID=A0ABY6KUN0_9ARAC|nr:hypothetical protein LAZ67_9002886 [Cordylochernes scorpioides]
MLFNAVHSVIYRLQAVIENEGCHIEQGLPYCNTVLYLNLREHLLAELSPEDKIILVKFLNTVIEHARDKDSITRNGLSELKAAISS